MKLLIKKKSNKPFSVVEGGSKKAIAIDIVDNPHYPKSNLEGKEYKAYLLKHGSIVNISQCEIIEDLENNIG